MLARSFIASFQGQSGLISRTRWRAWRTSWAGRCPDPVAERVRVGVPQVFAVVEAEEAGPGGQAGGDAGGEDPAAINLRVPKRSRWQRRFRVLRFRSASFWKTATLAALRTACQLHARSDGKPQ